MPNHDRTGVVEYEGEEDAALLDLLEEAFVQIMYLHERLTKAQREHTKPSTKALLDKIRPHLSDPDLSTDPSTVS